MKDLLACVYLARTPRGCRAFFTHNPEIDRQLLSIEHHNFSFDILSPFLPIGIAYYVLHSVFRKDEIMGYSSIDRCSSTDRVLADPWWERLWGAESYEKKTARKGREIFRLLNSMEAFFGKHTLMNNGVPDLPSPTTGQGGWAVDARVKEAVLGGLRGKMVFFEELERSISENTIALAGTASETVNLMDVLQILAFSGEIEVFPSLGLSGPGQAVCYRCGRNVRLNNTCFHRCNVCGFPFLYCEECIAMGVARLCRPLYALGEDKKVELTEKNRQIILRGVPPLTPAQTRASAELREFVTGSNVDEALVWAVCGAGKSEVVMGAMACILENNGRVLYASPRRDVVKELAPRLQAAFGSLEMLVSFGGSSEKFRRVPLTAATTHQVMRYYKQFDLVVLDEVDAFPYRGSRALQHAVRRSIKSGGKIIYLTATPDNHLLSRANSGHLRLVTIPARHHGRPVPEPEIERLRPFHKLPKGQWKVDPFIVQLLVRWLAEAERQVFIFLPTVGMVETFGPLLEKTLGKETLPAAGSKPGRQLIYHSHAGDPRREEKRSDFKEGKVPLLVSTTIMERGITVKKAHVLVLEADYERVFDEATLIQMAGRAGRSSEFPDGEAVFVGQRVTSSMLGAQAKIRSLNEMARKMNYLLER